MDNNVKLAALPLRLRPAKTEEDVLVSPGFAERGGRCRAEEPRTSGTDALQPELIPPSIASDHSGAASTVPDFSP